VGATHKRERSPYRFNLGRFACTVLWDGHFAEPYEGIFPNAAPDQFESLRRENGLAGTFIDTDVNVLVVGTGNEFLVVDTGMGEGARKHDEYVGRTRMAMKAAGIDAGDITHVLLTHLHPDHAFGLVDGFGAAVFPKATVCVTEADFKAWTDPSGFSVDDHRSDWVQGVIAAIRPYRDRISFVVEGRNIVAGVNAVMTPGHSSGHCCFTFESGGEVLWAIGDVAHYHAFELAHPEWLFSLDYDTAPREAARTRAKLFDRIADSGVRIMACHFPFPGIGTIERSREAFGFRAAG
jgi:glyoxylase-like metal-dependent hydrolase (beta-lactamase superfamily II)